MRDVDRTDEFPAWKSAVIDVSTTCTHGKPRCASARFSAIEQRNASAVAGRVADGYDFLRVTVWDQAEYQSIQWIDVPAEGAGQHDTLHVRNTCTVSSRSAPA